ncbi:uncharacterized protein LOC141700744, partial [Apium graveolens]|uniref:uncharacterized protein LOC141700744 n=1 Tax=Apium graveolens TaxID=4045 RepID=UPI003D78D402
MNNVISQSDKRGGRPYHHRLLQGFQDVLNDCDLIDMNLSGYHYTWERGLGTNNHIEVRLDRALVSPDFLNMFKEAKLTNLEVPTSYHCLIWLDPEIEALSAWGKEITDNFKGCINRSRKILKALKGMRDAHSVKITQEEKKLAETYAQQEVFWRQRSKQLWLREGNQNNKLFHATTKNRIKSNHISSLQDSHGNKVEWGIGLEQKMEEYFVNLFTATSTGWESVTNCTFSRVTTTQNELMLAEVDEKEVKAVLFNMEPDGISPGFYQKYWNNIVKTNMASIVKSFFDSGKLDDQLKGTNIALIPKKPIPVFMTDIHPISLCNVVYKIISKAGVLAAKKQGNSFYSHGFLDVMEEQKRANLEPVL